MGYKFARYTTSTAATPGGMPLIVQEGEAWDADDPLVLAHPELFSDEPLRVQTSHGRRDRVVEQATAAPGEKRRRP